jgi:hypothetical protein
MVGNLRNPLVLLYEQQITALLPLGDLQPAQIQIILGRHSGYIEDVHMAESLESACQGFT